MKQTIKTYSNGKDCEFRANGKLRGGKIIKETANYYRVSYHGPKYQEITLAKCDVRIL